MRFADNLVDNLVELTVVFGFHRSVHLRSKSPGNAIEHAIQIFDRFISSWPPKSRMYRTVGELRRCETVFIHDTSDAARKRLYMPGHAMPTTYGSRGVETGRTT